MPAPRPRVLLVLATAALPRLAAAQDTLAADLPDGQLRTPGDEGLPWTYIALVLLLIGVFFVLRRGGKPRPSKRVPRR